MTARGLREPHRPVTTVTAVTATGHTIRGTMALRTSGFRAPSTGGLKLPSFNVKPGSYADSVSLDQDMREEAGPVFVPWHDFASSFTFKQGEHCTLVGTTGSGKTTLARELLLPQRDYVVVLGTKAEDDSLYEPLMAQGF